MGAKLEDLLVEIREFMDVNQNPATVKKYARYFVEGYDAYGVDQKALDVQKGAWLADNREALGLDGFILLGDELVAGSKYEEVFLAFWFVKQFKERLDIKVFPRLAAWRTSPSKWMRRAVPVTLIKSVQAGMSIKTVLEFIAPLMLDREKVVHQDWAGCYGRCGSSRSNRWRITCWNGRTPVPG